jgi:1,4-dihydroxy-2-naphthoate octaprenyltransferase
MSEGLTAPHPLQIAALAIRPRTLSCAVVPVLVGTALAWRNGSARLGAALACLICSALIQIGTNLVNDYADAERGADTADRLGPTRVTQSGLARPRAVKLWAAATFAAAIVPGAYLVALGGWPILIAGLLSVASGYAYTAGPYPLGYHGLGDLFVLVFFGFVATLGCYWVQAGPPPPALWLAAMPVGALATAILAVNNLRDAPTDALAGKRTLAVRLGIGAARAEYAGLLAAAFGAPIALVALHQAGPWALLPLLAMPLAVRPLRLVLRASGGALNEALGATARLHLIAGALLALGLGVR